ncbi:MAG: hypothetical protein MUO52_08280 [Desulfobacterales bacterium]|nr:hypothetical protein [Desulfobacterales bacterium]
MKKAGILVIYVCYFVVFCSSFSMAEDFLGVPIMPDGKVLLKTKSRLEMASPMSHDEVKGFYEEALKNQKDIKFRNWADATYIEDDSNRKWHSITISKKPDQGMTSIVIMKDNWTWIIGTLVLRFIGVFVVLLCLFGGMSIAGSIISRSVKRLETKKQQAAA